VDINNGDILILETNRRLEGKGTLYPNTAVIVPGEEPKSKKHLTQKLKLTVCSPQ